MSCLQGKAAPVLLTSTQFSAVQTGGSVAAGQVCARITTAPKSLLRAKSEDEKKPPPAPIYSSNLCGTQIQVY